MKNIGLIIAVSFTVVIIGLIALFSFAPQNAANATNDAPMQVNTKDVASQEQVFSDREAAQMLLDREIAYQAQVTALNQWIEERQTTYESQMQELAREVTLGQQQFEQLQQSELALVAQLQQLQTARNERQAVYQTQLQQANAQYQAQLAELQNRIAEADAKLAEANAQLGR